MADLQQDASPPSRSSSCRMEGALCIDIFAKKPELRLPSGKKKFDTCLGFSCTLIYFAALIAYIAFKVMAVVEMEDVTQTDWSLSSKQVGYEGRALPEITFAYAIIDPFDPAYELDAAKVVVQVHAKSG